MGTLAGLLYLLHGLLFLRWFRVGLEPLTEPKFNCLLRRSAETLQLRRRLTLFCSPIVDSPITIGFRQPTIIIPAKLVNHLSDDEMQSILLHELAHVRQGDPLTGLLGRIIAAFCWWNPLLHRLLQVHSQSCEEVAASLFQ
nr:M56 family metallopeptidase [Victivallis sp. Marseille-Q1083]